MSKRDQWICWWSLPIFYNLFGLMFVFLGKVMPPPKPGLTQQEIVAFVESNARSMQSAWVLLSLTLGFASLSSGLIVTQMKRMRGVSPALAYAYLAVLAVAALPGCLFCGLMFALAAFRQREPQVVALLYDMGMLSFVGSLGCFVTQYLVFAIAIFLDRRGIFPKWLAYMSLWGIVTELVAIPIWIFRSGPYAWDGLISFYLGTVIFVVWEICLIICLYKAIKRQPLRELAR
jgi:predicted membrane protein